MHNTRNSFLFGIETECLTVIPEGVVDRQGVIGRFFQRLGQQAPSLSAYNGIFNAYGRCYFDVGHIELATSECASPYVLSTIVDSLQTLAARAARVSAEHGDHIILANNNHSGLLTSDCSVWGTHENYLVEQRPKTFTEWILPFLVTRLYAGAGGVTYPDGAFVAGARPIHMKLVTGGGTTDARAIHSTAGRPHHSRRMSHQYRYHLISGDGHRSQFNCALQAGTTALAAKVAIHFPETTAAAREIITQLHADNVTLMHKFNILSTMGKPLRIHPAVLAVQRIYLDGARHYARQLDSPPDWIERLLNDWEATLDALARMDRTWLAARLDAFAKYELFSAVLEDAGCNWVGLRHGHDLFHELALLNQNYHEFGNPDSAFRRLENAGLMQHRVAPKVMPGEEPEPFVPQTGTRAEPRARFLCAHRDSPSLRVSWTAVYDVSSHRCRDISDPFATEYGPWQEAHEESTREENIDFPDPHCFSELLLRRYDRGSFRNIEQFFVNVENTASLARSSWHETILRFRAWVQPRLGQLRGPDLLALLYRDAPESFRAISDQCHVLRYTGLNPDIDAMMPWIERGRRLLAELPEEFAPSDSMLFREHAAAALTSAGRLAEANAILKLSQRQRVLLRQNQRLHARFVAVRGEMCRRSGATRIGSRLLRAVYRIQVRGNYRGQMINYTLPALAKCATTRHEAITWLDCADTAIGVDNDAPVDQLRIALLRARITGPGAVADQTYRIARRQQQDLPALQTCPTLNRIVSQWAQWIAGEIIDDVNDNFWGI